MATVKMMKLKEINLVREFVYDLEKQKGSEGLAQTRMSAFCDWLTQRSVTHNSDDYLRSTTQILVELCVAIKISRSTNENCIKMAGNLHVFAMELQDDLENWIIAINEEEIKKHRGATRYKQNKLVDEIRRFDEMCFWKEFPLWITRLLNLQIETDHYMTNVDRVDVLHGNKPMAIRILFLAANPRDSTRLRLDEECRAIDQALRLSEFRDRFDVRQHWAVRIKDLQGILLRHKPNIVHFSGHGSVENEIVLEDDLGNSQPVSVRALSSLFSVLKGNIRCVVLNGCYSQIQAEAIAENIACVIGMPKAISDQSAISFATAFYQALGYGQEIKTAFDLGCVQIALEGLEEQDTPKLVAIQEDPRSTTFT